jgi:cation transport regulator ChaC
MSTYVFGYGSLINMNNNIELTNHLNKKSCPVIIKGAKRSLNVKGKKPQSIWYKGCKKLFL